MRIISRDLGYTLIALLLIGAIVFVRIILPEFGVQPDSPRWAHMGLNLAVHGTFAASEFSPAVPPEPGLGQGGPLTALELALAAWLDPNANAYLHCLTTREHCPGSPNFIKALYAIEVAVFLFVVFRIALLLANNYAVALLAAVAAALCKDTFRYSTDLMTEPLFLMTAGLFLWCWIRCWVGSGSFQSWLGAGLALGLMTLVKPVWNGVFPGLLVLLVWGMWRSSGRERLPASVLGLTLGYAAIALPFLLRNGLQIGMWSVSDPAYLVASLCHRFGYNLMSWNEWMMGWLYYVPDFGDNLATKWFGDAVSRLSWDKGGYYTYGRDVLLPEINATAAGSEAAQRLLIERYIFDMPLKNAAVTMLLLFRGIFVGGNWGTIAVLLVFPALWLMPAPRRGLWLMLLLPALGAALINAQASVSMSRYNLALIPAFALVWAEVIYWGATRLPVRAGLLAIAKTFFPNR